ncbi:tyrosine-type recombinase/integrase [Porphyrobacter algicida]|uniref:Tyrosine-type recombinase/integrase n=1 Tax=Qipengyuania algicida TaxID=1836209 RepID=A0A845AGM1_9SPHN|nr:tyrosine-type recombinase/integrase [Qipengyuania algicida]MXP28101.1 tyrosine-type recombinase/integrase [Qipengyuania algicida]
MAKRWLPKWVSEYEDRHGKKRYRFRRKGFGQYLFKSAPGTEEFRTEYRACCEGLAAPKIEAGAARTIPGTFDDLISRYYRSPDFLDPSDRTREVYRGVIERWRRKYGSAKVRDLEARHIEDMMAEMLPHRTAANMLRKRLRALMQFAIRQGMAQTNPVIATKPYKVDSAGFHTWSEDEIARYEARHPVGTMARLALDLMLWTGQRGGDARVIGPQHIRQKRLVVRQEKTGAIVSLPILPPLAASIMAAPGGSLVFLLSGHGKPYTRKGFGNKVRQWCDEAGLPQCSAHGLRKAAARRFAEAGCTNQQIKSWTGHTTDSEVSRYTAAADQEALSDAAAEMLMANLRKRLANDSHKSLKKGK